jgi:hypothetical protein
MRVALTILALIAAVAIYGAGNSGTTVHSGTTISKERFLCRQETMDHIYKLVGDEEAIVQFVQRQRLVGECSFTPPIGTKVRVEEHNHGLICIAPFGSDEPCQWTSSNAVPF